MNQDISLSVRGRNVSRTSEVKAFAELKAADRMPLTFGRRLSILGRYVGAVLTASLSPAAPILSIENEVRAFRNLNAVPRGFLELSLAVLSPRDFLSTPPTLARLEPAGNYQEGRESEAVCISFSMEEASC